MLTLCDTRCTVAPVIDELDARRIRVKQGAAIRTTRETLGRSRRDVIRAMEGEGVTATEGALAFWEAGDRRIPETASIAIAKVLGVPWSDLFGLDDEVA